MADDATYVLQHKAAPVPVTPKEQQQTMQLLSASLANELDADVDAGLPLGKGKPGAPGTDALVPTTSHPPDWARLALAQAQFQQHFPENATDDGRALGQMGVVLLRDLEKMWGDIMPLWVKISEQTPVATPANVAPPASEPVCKNPYLANAQ
jgi:hypothetical protein